MAGGRFTQFPQLWHCGKLSSNSETDLQVDLLGRILFQLWIQQVFYTCLFRSFPYTPLQLFKMHPNRFPESLNHFCCSFLFSLCYILSLEFRDGIWQANTSIDVEGRNQLECHGPTQHGGGPYRLRRWAIFAEITESNVLEKLSEGRDTTETTWGKVWKKSLSPNCMNSPSLLRFRKGVGPLVLSAKDFQKVCLKWHPNMKMVNSSEYPIVSGPKFWEKGMTSNYWKITSHGLNSFSFGAFIRCQDHCTNAFSQSELCLA